MKLIYSLLILLVFSTSCKKGDSDKSDSKCEDIPYSGDCEAYFQSWFYNKEKKQCEYIGYGGCYATGFETKEACEQMKCK